MGWVEQAYLIIQRVLKEKRELPFEGITIGTAIILMRGFTTNQEKWLKILDEKLKGRDSHG